MRVLMTSDVYFPRINGVSTSIDTFRRTLGSFGVELRLVVPSYQGEASTPDILRVAGRPVPRDPEDRLLKWRAMRQTCLQAAADCDLVHIQTPFVAHYAGVRAARKRGLPVMATYHTLFEEYLQHYAPMLPSGWLKQQARNFSRRQCNALDAVVVPSSAMQQRLLDYGVTKPIHVLPTGIPLDNFANGCGSRFRQQHGIAAERPMALFVGRVAHEKNIDFLLDALPHALETCPDLLLVIAGEGPARAELQQEVAQRGLQASVQFIGYMDRVHELPSCYAAADVFAFASTTETQGLVLLEAMAAGTPAVALAAMGTIDILAPGRGAVAPPAEARAYGQALATVLLDRSLLFQLSQDAVRYAAEWSDRAMASRLSQLYHSLAP
ncbi:glycosyltransferase [Brachymonas sp. G13]|uniref:glycosyltransferase n=1 Tax=Brachymonas wangyanguii TaxID=3130163 RepID=UPI00307E13BC